MSDPLFLDHEGPVEGAQSHRVHITGRLDKDSGLAVFHSESWSYSFGGFHAEQKAVLLDLDGVVSASTPSMMCGAGAYTEHDRNTIDWHFRFTPEQAQKAGGLGVIIAWKPDWERGIAVIGQALEALAGLIQILSTASGGTDPQPDGWETDSPWNRYDRGASTLALSGRTIPPGELGLTDGTIIQPGTESPREVPWERIGHANNVSAMAAINDKLFCSTRENVLWWRDPVGNEVAWQSIGQANEIAAMTATSGKLSCATRDNLLWWRDPVGYEVDWQRIGHANDVVAMAATSSKLFCATRDNLLWWRDPVGYELDWQVIGHANDVVGMAATDLRLFCATRDNRLRWRDTVGYEVNWEHIGHANDVVAMTQLNGKLFCATTDNSLWWRDPVGRPA